MIAVFGVYCAVSLLLASAWAEQTSTIGSQQQTETRTASDLKREGNTALNAKNYLGAIRLITDAITLDPSDPTLPSSLEEAITKSGKPEDAIPILQKALATAQERDSIRLILAQCYQHLDMDDKALQTLQYNYSPSSHSPVWLFTAAFSLFRLGQYDKAEVLFRQVISVEEIHPAASFFIGNCYFGRRDLTAALPWYESAIQLAAQTQTPALNAYYYNYGLALYRLDRFADASNAFFEASGLNSSDPLPPYFLGRSQADGGQTQDAVAIFEKIAKAHPDFSPAFYQLGVMYKRIRNEALAKAAFAKVGEIKKAELEDQRLLGEMQIGNGMAKESK